VVLSLIGKDKKKVTTSTKPLNDDYSPRETASERKWPKNLEEVLSEVLELPRQPEPVVETPSRQPGRYEALEKVENTYEKIGEEAQSLETIEPETFTYDSTEEIAKNKSRIMEVKTPLKAERQETEPVMDQFDLKQGIIYAEILNRKYF
jgi:hypothetical protein